MKILSFFKEFIKKTNDKLTENSYYEQLFVKNKYWNTPNPNQEEELRWEIIKGFLEVINNQNKIEYQNFNILDLGCGRGWLTNLLSDYGKVVGVEPVKPVVNYAKKLFPKIEFICGTSKEIIKDHGFNKYDLIVSSEVIEHIPDLKKEEFIEDISKLLNKKGFLIITTPRKEALEVWNSYMKPNQPIEDWISEIDLEKIVINKSFVKHKLERLSIAPNKNAPKIEIYQLWLFQKV